MVHKPYHEPYSIFKNIWYEIDFIVGGIMGQNNEYISSVVMALNNRAKAEIQKDKYLVAMKLLKMSLSYSPEFPETWELLSVCYFGLRKNGVGAECRSRALLTM